MIQVLFLAANPAGTTPLALDEEIRAIDAKIRGAEHRDRLELASHWAVRLDDLSGLLMRRRPDIVHFSGHGDPLGEIILLAADGTPKPVPAEALAGLFRVLKDNVRVVVFNACHSEAQAKAVVRVIDCAVGMSRAIDDDHAIAFAAEFYQALGFGRSVQDAYDLGVTRLTGEGVANAKGLVKLRKRRGINPADLVLVGDKHESNREPEVGAQPGRPAGQEASTPVSAPIKEEVRAVLRPLMPDRDRRKARLERAFAAYPGLLDRFTYDGETSVFLSSLIETLCAYGDVEPGVPALAVLLESLRGEVGAGDRQHIDQILRAVRGTVPGP